MTHHKISDREIYPALWITLGGMAISYLVWRYPLGRPKLAACIFYTHLHLYCPACGGTRAVLTLLHGEIGRSFYYQPLVPFVVVSVLIYLLSQTVWRLRGRRGFVLHYSNWWLRACLFLLLAQFVVRNFFLLILHQPI